MTDVPIRFGLQGGPFVDPAALADHARLVESLGYDELFTADHTGTAAAAADHAHVDPFAPLVAAACATTTLRVGPLVLNNEFHQPVLLARTAATVDALSGGRLVLGLGSGYAADEHDAIGQPIRRPGPRVNRFEESLTVLRALLDDGSVDYDGDHEHVHIGALGVRPAQSPVPFLIGGHGPRMVALAGRFADIFQFTGLTHDERGGITPGGFALDHLRDRAEWLDRAASGRTIERSALVQFTHIGSEAPSPDELVDRFKLDADVIAETPFILSGSLEQVVDKVHRLREGLGITHWVVRDAEGCAPLIDACR